VPAAGAYRGLAWFVVHKGAVYFVVANAAAQPAQKHNKLDANGNKESQKMRPIK